MWCNSCSSGKLAYAYLPKPVRTPRRFPEHERTEHERTERERLAQALTKRHRQPRKRAAAAGKPHSHPLPDRLRLALLWLRVSPILEVRGFFFGLDKTNVEDNLTPIKPHPNKASPQ